MSFEVSNRPQKRRRIEETDLISNLDHDDHHESDMEDRAELEKEQWQNQDRFRHRMEDIFKKYSLIQADDGDEVNIRTGAIEVDRGHLKALPNADYDDVCESFTSEEDGIADDHDEDILDFLQTPAYKAPDWSEEVQGKQKHRTIGTWLHEDEMRPLEARGMLDLPSEETILRQFGSAGPAVLEVLKQQASDQTHAIRMPVTPEDTQFSGAESHEDDDLSILPLSPFPVTTSTTPIDQSTKRRRSLQVQTPTAQQLNPPSNSHMRSHNHSHPVDDSMKTSYTQPLLDKKKLFYQRLSQIGQANKAKQPMPSSPRMSNKIASEKIGKPDNSIPKLTQAQTTQSRQISITGSDLGDKSFTCRLCRRTFTKLKKRLAHEQKQSCLKKRKVREQIICPAGCGKIYSYPNSMRHHLAFACPCVDRTSDEAASEDESVPDNEAVSASAANITTHTHLPNPQLIGQNDRSRILLATVLETRSPKDETSMPVQYFADEMGHFVPRTIDRRDVKPSLRPQDLRPDYRLRLPRKKIVRIVDETSSAGTISQEHVGEDVEESLIIVLKIPCLGARLAELVSTMTRTEGATICAWQKNGSRYDLDEDFNHVPGWGHSIFNDPQSQEEPEDLLHNPRTAVEPTRSHIDEEGRGMHILPRLQMPTPPPDLDDPIFCSRTPRSGSLNQKAQPTTFQEFIELQDAECNEQLNFRSPREVADSDPAFSSDPTGLSPDTTSRNAQLWLTMFPS